KCLRRLFYMSPDQIKRWLEFGNIVLNDNTSTTNHYEIALSLFLALTDDETKEAPKWIL
ncbi:35449_t:CDS:2, partial [Gigaspora margarita]